MGMVVEKQYVLALTTKGGGREGAVFSDSQMWLTASHAGDTWVNRDPLVTSTMLVRIQQRQDALVSRGEANAEVMAKIQWHYGPPVFKCPYPFCMSNRSGFHKEEDLHAHLTDHGRDWKCIVPGCLFTSRGFTTRYARDEHLAKVHLEVGSHLLSAMNNGSNDISFDTISVDDASHILFQLVAQNDADRLTQLLASPGGKQLNKDAIAAALRYAARDLGSQAMTEALMPAGEKYLPAEILAFAVGSQDINFVRSSLARARNQDSAGLLKVVLGSASDEIYALWEKHFFRTLEWVSNAAVPKQELRRLQNKKAPEAIVQKWQKALHTRTLKPAWALLETVFRKQRLWNSLKGNALKETRMKLLLKTLQEKGYLTAPMMGDMLVRMAGSGCSVSLGEELLSYGAPIDFPINFGKSGKTALGTAAQKTTEEAAYFMRMLIRNGANPTNIGYEIKYGKAKGAAQIVEWLGVTWDELVDEYRRSTQRQGDTQEAPIELGDGKDNDYYSS
jgi:hypothetical protein